MGLLYDEVQENLLKLVTPEEDSSFIDWMF